VHISVIIPAFNEAKSIQACLEQFENAEDLDVVVVDGGSDDNTPQVVEAFENGRCVIAPGKGRATQMNFGAQCTEGACLLFLHADTFLPHNGIDLIREAMAQPQVVGGRFQLGLSETSWSFRLIALMSTWRSKYLGVTYGDQGIFVRRDIFERVGGYPALDLFEDSEFCKLLGRQGHFALLPAKVCSATRRWRRWGIWRTVMWMWLLRLLFVCGVSDKKLSQWYRSVR